MIEAMKQALENLDEYYITTPEGQKLVTSLRQAIEQAEKQEPVAWMYDRAKYRENDLRGRQWAFKCVSQTKPYMDEMVRNVTPLYTTPQPQREWVGLTEDDRNEILINAAKHNWDDRLIVKQMETKLKERNGGNT